MVEQKQDTTDAYAIKLDAPTFLENNKDEVELETIEFTYDKLERKQYFSEVILYSDKYTIHYVSIHTSYSIGSSLL